MAVKLTYFDGRGVAEPIRMIMSYGGIEFDDIRIPYDAFPPTLPANMKAGSRWGTVPRVEFDGKQLNQSLAITRYYAKKANLVPKDDYLAALCDEYVDAFRDYMTSFRPVIAIQDDKEKMEKMKELVATNKTKYLDVFEKIAKDNGGKHLVGNSLTWADVYLGYVYDIGVHRMGVDLTDGFPNMKSVKDNALSSPKIKAWLEKRPVTKY